MAVYSMSYDGDIPVFHGPCCQCKGPLAFTERIHNNLDPIRTAFRPSEVLLMGGVVIGYATHSWFNHAMAWEYQCVECLMS
jgi:hypothetical protein